MSGRAIETFLPMVPPRVTHNDLEVHRHGKATTIGKSADLREAEASLGARVAKVAPDVPLSCPLRLQGRVCWPCGARHGQG